MTGDSTVGEWSPVDVTITDTPALSIMMPAYNEQRTIRRAIEGVLATPFPLEIELIVVDDGSTDRTSEILAAGDWPANVRIRTHEHNQGKGPAVRTALAEARGEYATIFDADLECDPGDLTRLLQPMLSGTEGVAFGARAFDVNTHHSPIFRLGNRGVTLATNVLFRGSVADVMSCQKMMRTELFRSLPLRDRGFGIETEITARLLQRKELIFEVPVRYEARKRKDGKKIAVRDGLHVLRTLVRCRVTRARAV